MGMIEDVVLGPWLEEHGGAFDAFGFNVPVWMDPPEKQPIVAARGGRSVRSEPYRVDVVGRIGDECELIEVKETGNMTAIGQVLTYSMLFQRSYYGYKSLHLRMVCVRAPEAIRLSSRIHKITVDEAGAKASRLVRQVRKRNKSTL